MLPIQYTPGMMPFQNSILPSRDSVAVPVKSDSLTFTAPVVVNNNPVKSLENKVIKKAVVKDATNKKTVQTKIKKQINPSNNKSNNKSFINKKKSAKALMPSKITSKNNNN